MLIAIANQMIEWRLARLRLALGSGQFQLVRRTIRASWTSALFRDSLL